MAKSLEGRIRVEIAEHRKEHDLFLQKGDCGDLAYWNGYVVAVLERLLQGNEAEKQREAEQACILCANCRSKVNPEEYWVAGGERFCCGVCLDTWRSCERQRDRAKFDAQVADLEKPECCAKCSHKDADSEPVAGERKPKECMCSLCGGRYNSYSKHVCLRPSFPVRIGSRVHYVGLNGENWPAVVLRPDIDDTRKAGLAVTTLADNDPGEPVLFGVQATYSPFGHPLTWHWPEVEG